MIWGAQWNPNQSLSAYLLASKRVIKCTAEEILKVVLDSFNKLEISTNQLLMFMSDGAAQRKDFFGPIS